MPRGALKTGAVWYGYREVAGVTPKHCLGWAGCGWRCSESGGRGRGQLWGQKTDDEV